MKKKLLAVAIAGAFAAPLALADEGNVTIYGTASVAVEAIDIDGSSYNFDATQVNNNHSALGVKGWEPLGNGLKAVFLFDMFVGLDNSAGGGGGGSLLGGGRDGYVGLAGNFGTVALGFHARPYKTSTNHLDLFGSTIADNSAIMGSYRFVTPGPDDTAYFDGGNGNAVIWFLPNMNGFSGHLQYGADEADDDTNDWGAQANYTNGPLYVSASYDDDGEASRGFAGSTDIDIWKLAASYTFMEATTVTGMWESMDLGSGFGDRDAFYLGAAHKFGNNTVKIAYANADNTDVGSDGADQWSVGLDHSLSKRTTVYALYTQLDNDSNGRYRLVSSPHTSSYDGGFDTTGSDGFLEDADFSAFSVGIKHNF